MQFVYVNDLVEAMVRAMTEPRAVGEAFNIGDSKPLTQVELVERLAKAANTEPTLVRMPRDVIHAGRRQRHGRAVLFRRISTTCRPSP